MYSHRAMIIIAIAANSLALPGCSATGIPASTLADTPAAVQLSVQQRQIVDHGVRQMIKEGSAVKIISVTAAKGTKPGQTNVCGFVRFLSRDGRSSEQRYFIRLGQENGSEAALMGQVANSTANSAKVRFMCSKAGLD